MVAHHKNRSIGKSAKMQNVVSKCLATSSVLWYVRGRSKHANEHCIKAEWNVKNVKNRQGETEKRSSEKSAKKLPRMIPVC